VRYLCVLTALLTLTLRLSAGEGVGGKGGGGFGGRCIVWKLLKRIWACGLF